MNVILSSDSLSVFGPHLLKLVKRVKLRGTEVLLLLLCVSVSDFSQP